MKNRLQRVNELLKRELSQCIERDMEFPGTLVTVHDVDVTPDLRKAHVYVGVIGDARQCSEVVKKLNRNRNHLQQEVSRRVTLKNTPHFEFRGDDSVARGVRVVALLDQIALTLPADPDTPLVAEHKPRGEWHNEEDVEEDLAEEEEEEEEADDWDDDDDLDEEDWEEVDEEADDDLGLVFGEDDEDALWKEDDDAASWKDDDEDDDDY